jgi:hypothetical protein
MDTTDLYQLAAELSSARLQEVEALGASLLALPPKRSQLAFRSTLNNDGSPLQVCLTSSSRSRSVRLLGDPGSYITNPTERLDIGRDALTRLGEATGCDSIAPVSEWLLRGLLPDAYHGQAETSSGAMWIAAVVNQPGAAAYIKARWGSPADDWMRTLAALQSVLPAAAEAERMVGELRDKARVMSVGIETAPFGDMRVKVYWRLRTPALLSSISIPLLQHPAIANFLLAVVGDRAIPLTGLVFSTGFLLSSGAVEDIKADLCAHCITLRAAEWMDVIDQCAVSNGLQAFSLRDSLSRWRAEMAFLGFAVNRESHVRLNVYLKWSDARQN